MMTDNDYSKYLSSLLLEQYKPDIHVGKMAITSYQSKGSDKSSIDHTEDIIIGSEQGMTFPTKIGTTLCNALIDTGITRCCISEKYYKNYSWLRSICYKMLM